MAFENTFTGAHFLIVRHRAPRAFFTLQMFRIELVNDNLSSISMVRYLYLVVELYHLVMEMEGIKFDRLIIWY
jgi:hypothetical protein